MYSIVLSNSIVYNSNILNRVNSIYVLYYNNNSVYTV